MSCTRVCACVCVGVRVCYKECFQEAHKCLSHAQAIFIREFWRILVGSHFGRVLFAYDFVCARIYARKINA